METQSQHANAMQHNHDQHRIKLLQASPYMLIKETNKERFKQTEE